MATVKLTNVKKIYGKDTVAVQDFNLDIADKEFIVFVGPSGCGKSTTLRMIAGLEDISAGTVEIDGVVVNDLQPRDRNIAMVFQNYALYPHMTVKQNILFPLQNLKGADKLSKEEMLERLEGLLQGKMKQCEISGAKMSATVLVSKKAKYSKREVDDIISKWVKDGNVIPQEIKPAYRIGIAASKT